MIGFLMGTSIAFFVVMGDLAPPIIANLTGVESSAKLRLVILVGRSDTINNFIRAQRLINLEIPVLVRSLKSSNVELG